ncbi:MAG: hypothetical protein LBR89_03515 [Holosporales bacterium]|nr:hypothetical protein [Holosporales bacterium]
MKNAWFIVVSLFGLACTNGYCGGDGDGDGNGDGTTDIQSTSEDEVGTSEEGVGTSYDEVDQTQLFTVSPDDVCDESEILNG